MSIVLPVLGNAPAGSVVEPPPDDDGCMALEAGAADEPLLGALDAGALLAPDEDEPADDVGAELDAELGAELLDAELLEVLEELDDDPELLLLQAATSNPADNASARPARFLFTWIPLDRRRRLTWSSRWLGAGWLFNRTCGSVATRLNV